MIGRPVPILRFISIAVPVLPRVRSHIARTPNGSGLVDRLALIISGESLNSVSAPKS